VLFLGLALGAPPPQTQAQAQAGDEAAKRAQEQGKGQEQEQEQDQEQEQQHEAMVEEEILRLCAQHGRIVGSGRREVVTVRPLPRAAQPDYHQQEQQQQGDDGTPTVSPPPTATAATATALHVEVRGFGEFVGCLLSLAHECPRRLNKTNITHHQTQPQQFGDAAQARGAAAALDGLELRGRRLSAILQPPPPVPPATAAAQAAAATAAAAGFAAPTSSPVIYPFTAPALAPAARALTMGSVGTPLSLSLSLSLSQPPQPERPVRALSEGAGDTLVCLRGLVGDGEAAALEREEREELVANVRELCQAYGRVISVSLAFDGGEAGEEGTAALAAQRGSSAGSSGGVGDGSGDGESLGGGGGPAVLVRFETGGEAQRAVAGLSTRVVQGQRIVAALMRERGAGPVPVAPAIPRTAFGGASPRFSGALPYLERAFSASSAASSVASYPGGAGIGGGGGGGGVSPFGSNGGGGGGGGGGGDITPALDAPPPPQPTSSLAGPLTPSGRRLPNKYADAATAPKVRGDPQAVAGGVGVGAAGPLMQAQAQAASGALRGAGAVPLAVGPGVVAGGVGGAREDAVMCTEELEEQVNEYACATGRKHNHAHTILTHTHTHNRPRHPTTTTHR
jgi:hypothetical protein